ADPAGRCAQGCGAGLIDPVRALQAVARMDMDDPPSLHVGVDHLDLGAEESAVIRVENRGGHPLAWRARVKGAAASNVKLSENAGELLRWRLPPPPGRVLPPHRRWRCLLPLKKEACLSFCLDGTASFRRDNRLGEEAVGEG